MERTLKWNIKQRGGEGNEKEGLWQGKKKKYILKSMGCNEDLVGCRVSCETCQYSLLLLLGKIATTLVREGVKAKKMHQPTKFYNATNF